ncbi:unnamed protein product [Discula destructiva]
MALRGSYPPIYVTVGNEIRADFLVQERGISRSHVFCSRDVRFARQLMTATRRGRKCLLGQLLAVRISLGLLFPVLDVGCIQDIGHLTRKQDMLKAVVSAGVRALTEQDALDGLQLGHDKFKIHDG